MDGPASAALDEGVAYYPVHAGSRTLCTDPPDSCRRVGAEEVAPTVALLASDAPDFMSGAIFGVNAASYLRSRGRPGESKPDEDRGCESCRVEAGASLWSDPIFSAMHPHEILEMQLTKRGKRARTADLISLRVIIHALQEYLPSVASAWRQVRNLRTPLPTRYSPLFAWVVVNCCQENDRNYRPSLPKALRCFILPTLICTSDRLWLSAALNRLEARSRSNSFCI